MEVGLAGRIFAQQVVAHQVGHCGRGQNLRPAGRLDVLQMAVRGRDDWSRVRLDLLHQGHDLVLETAVGGGNESALEGHGYLLGEEEVFLNQLHNRLLGLLLGHCGSHRHRLALFLPIPSAGSLVFQIDDRDEVLIFLASGHHAALLARQVDLVRHLAIERVELLTLLRMKRVLNGVVLEGAGDADVAADHAVSAAACRSRGHGVQISDLVVLRQLRNATVLVAAVILAPGLRVCHLVVQVGNVFGLNYCPRVVLLLVVVLAHRRAGACRVSRCCGLCVLHPKRAFVLDDLGQCDGGVVVFGRECFL